MLEERSSYELSRLQGKAPDGATPNPVNLTNLGKLSFMTFSTGVNQAGSFKN
jgi:hypothetical protein